MLSNNVDAVLDQIEAQQADRFELEPNATSLTLLQKVYRSSSVALQTRMRAAGMALQFEHPKLAVAVTINSGDFGQQLDQACERSQRVIEATPTIEADPMKAIEGDSDVSSDTKTSCDLKPTVPKARAYAVGG